MTVLDMHDYVRRQDGRDRALHHLEESAVIPLNCMLAAHVGQRYARKCRFVSNESGAVPSGPMTLWNCPQKVGMIHEAKSTASLTRDLQVIAPADRSLAVVQGLKPCSRVCLLGLYSFWEEVMVFLSWEFS